MPPKAKDSPARKRVPKEPKEPKEKGAGKAKKDRVEEKAAKEEEAGECSRRARRCCIGEPKCTAEASAWPRRSRRG